MLVDDLRFDAMGFMTHPWLETPNLDALARSGVHFRNAFVTTALCSPSRASILTGQYAHRHRVVDSNLIRDAERRETVSRLNAQLFETLGATGGMYIPLSPDRGGSQNLRRRGGSRAADFPPGVFAR